MKYFASSRRSINRIICSNNWSNVISSLVTALLLGMIMTMMTPHVGNHRNGCSGGVIHGVGGGFMVASVSATSAGASMRTLGSVRKTTIQKMEDDRIALSDGFELVAMNSHMSSGPNSTTSTTDKWMLQYSFCIPSSENNGNSSNHPHPHPPSYMFMSGNGRYEFRIVSTTVSSSASDKMILFGYPYEMQLGTTSTFVQLPPQLMMPITTQEQMDLLRSNGIHLQVWHGGMKVNRDGKKGSTSSRRRRATTTSGSTTVLNPTPKINVHPAARGKFRTRRFSYNLSSSPLNIPNYPEPVEVLAEVYQPVNISRASPVVLFLHGRHITCYKNESDTFNWPCRDGSIPVPSYKGYSYVGDILASQGYFVVSISANGINGQDANLADGGIAGRSYLIRHHLNLLTTWNTVGGHPWNGKNTSSSIGTMDMNKVVLVGHSRGGEGAHRAAIETTVSDPYKIVGLVTYGPTASGKYVTPDIHSATILPICDGDVSGLEGQAYVDRSRDIVYSEALRSAVVAIGANHNYFNTEWTPGLSQAPSEDDSAHLFEPSDPVCGTLGTIRLTPKEQQIVGATYTAALIRLAVNQDVSMLPLLDGSNVKSAAIGDAEVAVNAVGGASNRLLFAPGVDGSVSARSGMNGTICAGPSLILPDGYATPRCRSDFDDFDTDPITPHFDGTVVGPPPLLYEMSWSSSRVGSLARFDLSLGSGNLSSHDWINLRIANDPNKPSARFDLMLTDRRGKNVNVNLDLFTVDGWPGSETLDRIHARTIGGRLQVARIRSAVDLTRIRSVSLIPRTSDGRVWLLDVTVTRNQIVQPTVLDLPVVSIVDMVVQEGSVGGVAKVNVTIAPTPKEAGEAWLFKSSTFELFQLNITAGSDSVLYEENVAWSGNNFYDLYFPSREFSLVATKGVVVGNPVGGLTIVEDDPTPIISAVATSISVVEDQSLRWTLLLSVPTNGLFIYLYIIPPTAGQELSSDDVDQSWLEQNARVFVTEPQPLSTLQIGFFVYFPPGEVSIDVVIPIVVDDQAEPNESIQLFYFDQIQNPLQPKLYLSGSVLAHS